MTRDLFLKLGNILFVDPVRPIELLSCLNLLAWANLLFANPDLLERDSYVSFQVFGAITWVCILAFGSAFQVFAAFQPRSRTAVLRIIGIGFASGVWLMIAVNFLASGIETTAHGTYFLLSATCLMGGVYLGWAK